MTLHAPDPPPFPGPEPAAGPRRSCATPLLLGLLVLVVLWRELPWRPWRLLDPDAQPRTVTPRGDLAPMEQSTIELFEAAKPSVVHITTTERLRIRTLLGTRSQEVERGSGSGFVWDREGTLVTNFHVLAGAHRVYVKLADDSDLVEGFVVGGDPDHDLAVLKIDPRGRNLRPLPLGESGDLRVGQSVFAIGNPFGFDWTLTTGVISGLDRSILSVAQTPIEGVIQTDAAINPGNSGGPLLDSAGRLIGINTSIYSPSGASAGIGFAVPVDTVNRIVPVLIATGRPPRAGLGILMAADAFARQRGLRGVVVGEVSPGGGAERAGILPRREGPRGEDAFDVIVAIDGRPVTRQSELREALAAHQVGDRVALRVLRDGREVELEVQLQDVR